MGAAPIVPGIKDKFSILNGDMILPQAVGVIMHKCPVYIGLGILLQLYFNPKSLSVCYF
jgi:hypothetical protein